MNGYNFIINKQINWAKNNDIELIGKKIDRGRKSYTKDLKDNIFQGLKKEVKSDISQGQGGELDNYPPKMSAVHSSSALVINIFQYWKYTNQISKIAYASRFCNKENKISKDIKFEQKYSIIKGFNHHPNIDIIIKNKDDHKYRVYGIESKFSEPYQGHNHSGIKKVYLDLDIWEDIPKLKLLAEDISPDDKEYKYLHAAQLIKHILGLKNTYGKSRFRLLYLWYNVPGEEGAKHKNEIEEFKKIVKQDNIIFHDLSYQELIIKLSNHYREQHNEYIKYISERYL